MTSLDTTIRTVHLPVGTTCDFQSGVVVQLENEHHPCDIARMVASGSRGPRGTTFRGSLAITRKSRERGMRRTERYVEWKRMKNDVACGFARLMAANPNGFGQRLEEVTNATAAAIAARVADRVTAAIADDSVDALTLVLPEITTPSTLVEIALDLKMRPGWAVEHWTLPSTPAGPLVAFGITHEVKLASRATVPSEALVLGPFEAFPVTRAAPVAALELFVGTPPNIDPKTKSTPTKANLAHVNVTPPLTQANFDRVWASTIRNRLAVLGGVDDVRARAKVAFVVRPAVAHALGCEP